MSEVKETFSNMSTHFAQEARNARKHFQKISSIPWCLGTKVHSEDLSAPGPTPFIVGMMREKLIHNLSRSS